MRLDDAEPGRWAVRPEVGKLEESCYIDSRRCGFNDVIRGSVVDVCHDLILVTVHLKRGHQM